MEKICGVYCIENLVNHKKYIGSSVNIYRRWSQHKRELNGNYHYNNYLQNAFNKYGKDNFAYFIIETCSEEDRVNREQYWIDNYMSCNELYGYNIAKFAGLSGVANVEENLDNNKYIISRDDFDQIIYYLANTTIPITLISKKLDISIHLIYSIYNHKAYNSLTKDIVFKERRSWNNKISEEDVRYVIQLLLDGKTYDEIFDITNIDKKQISDIRNKRSWKWITEDIIFPKLNVSHPNKMKKINQYSKDGKYIKTFNSATDVIKELKDFNIHHSSIVQSCKDDTNVRTSGGYLWKYYEEYSDCKDLTIKNKIVKRNRIAVNQYSNDYEFIRQFNSFYEAYQYTGICASMISNACKNNKIAGGYIWEYAS